MAKEPDLECKSHPENVGFVLATAVWPTLSGTTALLREQPFGVCYTDREEMTLGAII